MQLEWSESKTVDSLRFQCNIYLNQRHVALGFGPNKASAKSEAHSNALLAVCPSLYAQWKQNATMAGPATAGKGDAIMSVQENQSLLLFD